MLLPTPITPPDSPAAPPGCPLKDCGNDGIVHLGLWVAGVSPRCEAIVENGLLRPLMDLHLKYRGRGATSLKRAAIA